jgi:kinesin family protein 13
LTHDLKAKNNEKSLTLASAAASSGYGSQSTPTDSSCCSDSVESQPRDGDQDLSDDRKGVDTPTDADGLEINGNDELEPPTHDSNSRDVHAEDKSAGIDRQAASLPDWLILGESIRTVPDSKTGLIAFLGPTHFASGLWVGVVLDTPLGKNDGTVDGVNYFTCKSKYGIFVRPDKLRLDVRGRSLRKAPNSSQNTNSTKAR